MAVLAVRAVIIWQIGILHIYCMQDVYNILLYCNADVVIIKPVTGRVSICSTSVKQKD